MTEVVGTMLMEVSDPQQFVADPNVRMAMQETIATVAGVPPDRVEVRLTASRRLTPAAADSERRLQSGSVSVDYTITLPSDGAAATASGGGAASGSGGGSVAAAVAFAANATSVVSALQSIPPSSMTQLVQTTMSAMNATQSGRAYSLQVRSIPQPVVTEVVVPPATTTGTTLPTAMPSCCGPSTSMAWVGWLTGAVAGLAALAAIPCFCLARRRRARRRRLLEQLSDNPVVDGLSLDEMPVVLEETHMAMQGTTTSVVGVPPGQFEVRLMASRGVTAAAADSECRLQSGTVSADNPVVDGIPLDETVVVNGILVDETRSESGEGYMVSI